jgi:hypothetical protein
MTKRPDTDNDGPKDEPPGPADHGREGGMATRENAPELTEPERDD